MTRQVVLITGGYGCIGAETAKWLLRNSEAEVVVCSRSVSQQRTDRRFHDVDQSRMSFVAVDVTEQTALESLLAEYQVTRVVHMAALQTPDCNANRDLGLQINLGGAQNLIEAMKASDCQLERFVFASSVAIYGPRATYPEGRVPMLAEPNPVNVYGVWKLAGEQISSFFHDDTGVPTVILRPGVLYGPGRDAGLTATPTTAMKCVALGRSYEIPFRSRQDYLFAPDVGGAVGNAVMKPFSGCGRFTLPSRTLETEQIAAAVRDAAQELGLGGGGKITVGDEEVPFICDLEYQPFIDAFPDAPHTSLEQAIRETLTVFAEQVERGWLTSADVV